PQDGPGVAGLVGIGTGVPGAALELPTGVRSFGHEGSGGGMHTVEVLGRAQSARRHDTRAEPDDPGVPADGSVGLAPVDPAAAVADTSQTLHLVRRHPGTRPGSCEVMATLPPVYPEWLGDRSFTTAHGVRFPYVAGEMANGIATTRMVVAMARAQML